MTTSAATEPSSDSTTTEPSPSSPCKVSHTFTVGYTEIELHCQQRRADHKGSHYCWIKDVLLYWKR